MSRHAAVILAAGLGSRYRASGGDVPTKLVARLDGQPLVRRVVEAACHAGLDPVIVVTGHAPAAVAEALQGLPVRLAHNADFAGGLAGSLRTGVARVPPRAPGVLVLLGDMPNVSVGLLAALLAGAEADPDADAVVPVVAGRRGNPVILSRRLFPAIATLEGDAGARHLLRQPGVTVRDVPVEDDAAVLDIDTPDDLAQAAVQRAASQPR